MEKALKKLYLTPGEASSFSSAQRLYTAAREHGLNVTLSEVKKFLQGIESYTLHRQVRRHFPRQKIRSDSINEIWEADLASFQNIAAENKGFAWVLVTVDVLSKFAYAVPIQSKHAKDVIGGFQTIFAHESCIYLHTDRGKEFLSEEIKKYFRKRKVYHYLSHSTEQKAACAERLIRTIKQMLYKIFTQRSSTRYLDILPDVMHAYNNRVHRSIKMKPADVRAEDVPILKQRLYGTSTRPVHKVYKFKVGTKVRITVAKGQFEKGYTRNFTEEIFKISSRRYSDSNLPIYQLEEDDGSPITGNFYEDELQEVKKTDDIYKVEKVLKTRGRGRRTEYFVKWAGYPDKYNSWIPKGDLQKL